MPTSVVTLRDGFDVSAEMARLHNWFDTQRGSPSAFNYRHDGDAIVIEVTIQDDETAERFTTVLPRNASAATRSRQ